MTVENMFSTYPVAGMMPPQDDSLSHVPLNAAFRTRNHSGGSTGSYGSTSSSSCNSEMTFGIQFQPQLGSIQAQPQMQQSRKMDRSISCPSQSNAQKNVNPTRYKTELCRPYEESGYCKYGEKCQFAHGHHELRNLSRHPKYKSELCRTYHTVGFCPYGPRCHFIHNEDELKLHEITHLKQQQVLKQVAHQVVQQQQQQQVLSHFAIQQPTPTSPNQVPMNVGAHFATTRPCTVPRPRSLDFSHLSLPMPLGSTIDSPPASVTDSSPSLSPTSMLGDDVFTTVPSPPPGFQALPAGTSPAVPKMFNFQEMPMLRSASNCKSIDVTTPLNISIDPIASLTANLEAALLIAEQKRGMNCQPTPPLSGNSSDVCESPMDIGKGLLRLPIFSQFGMA